MSTPEFTTEEKALLAALEPIIRNAVWASTASNGWLSQPGKWIEYPLTMGTKNRSGKYLRLSLDAGFRTETFLESFCPFGSSHLHTSIAVYGILRELKKRGILQIPGFECSDVRPPTKKNEV